MHRFLVRYQHILIFPILLFARISWREHPPAAFQPPATLLRCAPQQAPLFFFFLFILFFFKTKPKNPHCAPHRAIQSVSFNASPPPGVEIPFRGAELATLGLHYSWYLGVAFTWLPIHKAHNLHLPLRAARLLPPRRPAGRLRLTGISARAAWRRHRRCCSCCCPSSRAACSWRLCLSSRTTAWRSTATAATFSAPRWLPPATLTPACSTTGAPACTPAAFRNALQRADAAYATPPGWTPRAPSLTPLTCGGDRFTGGLNMQIEHHLFPTLPRHNLRKACGLLLLPGCRHTGHH